MTGFLRRWRPRHLLAAWGAYWAALVLVVLGEPARIAWRMSRTENAGTAAAGAENDQLFLRIVETGGATWSGSADATTVALAVFGPPLLLWLLWLLLRPRETASPLAAAPEPPRLHDAAPGDLDRAAVERAAARAAEHREPGAPPAR